MSVFGGMSKGERNRIKIRVKAAMGAQIKDGGRFLGGHPPYGYLIADSSPHPNPARWRSRCPGCRRDRHRAP
jgi:site-specific DNA recombinase